MPFKIKNAAPPKNMRKRYQILFISCGVVLYFYMHIIQIIFLLQRYFEGKLKKNRLKCEGRLPFFRNCFSQFCYLKKKKSLFIMQMHV